MRWRKINKYIYIGIFIGMTFSKAIKKKNTINNTRLQTIIALDRIFYNFVLEVCFRSGIARKIIEYQY